MVKQRAYRPQDLQQALKIREETGAIPIAGGTDLMVKQRRWSGVAPFFELPLLFIGHLEELKGVECTKNHIKIASACTLTSLLGNESVPQFMRTAIIEIGSPAIRNMATIGGNICNASPAGDTLPILYALDASLVLENSKGKRSLSIEHFIEAPGRTALKENELLTLIILPLNSFNVILYKKVGPRRANSLSKLSFFGLAKTERGRVEQISVSFGAVAPTVLRSREIENKLKGKTGKDIEKMIPEIIKLYSCLISPIDDQRSNAHYRRETSLKLLEYFLSVQLMSKI